MSAGSAGSGSSAGSAGGAGDAGSGGPVGGAYNNWNTTAGQPDNAASASYEADCLYMSWGDSGLWQDWWCLQFLDYVCETP